MTAPAASVLMLLYNRPQFMRQAIESVLGQTFGDFEFIVMDHASKTPEPFDIAKEYAAKDSRMRVFRADENRGVSAGRNRVLAEAQGEFVATIEDDDWWAADKLEKQIAFLREHPEVGTVDCAYVYVDMKGKPIGQNTGADNQTHPKTCAPSAAIDGRRINGSGQCFRRAALNAVGGWRPWFEYADDDDLFLRMQEKYAAHSFGSPLLYYRIGDNIGANKLAHAYRYAAMYSAHCRRNGEADVIGESPSLESVLVRGAKSGFATRKIVMKMAKKLLQNKSYGMLRAFLAADKSSGGGGAKFFVKLAYWSLVCNRLGFWFHRGKHRQKGQSGGGGIITGTSQEN